MSKEFDIEIAVVVGSNGKWSAHGFGTTEKQGESDWGILMDDIMDWPDKGDPIDPTSKQRYVLKAKVALPEGERVIEVVATPVK